MQIGLVGYGACIPRHRIAVKDIFDVWNNTVLEMLKGIKIEERAVLQPDEDTITMAVLAAKRALKQSGLAPEQIDSLYLGTGTSPWDSKASAMTVAEALGLRPNIFIADVQFSGKSATAAMQMAMGLIGSGMTKFSMVIGSDTINRHVAPGDLYEYTACAGAVALIIGSDRIIAEIEGTASYGTDFSDFFRQEGSRFIRMGGQDIPALLDMGLIEHSVIAAKALFHKLGTKPSDYSYAVFQAIYGFVPFAIGGALGFSPQQIGPGVIAPMIGDCGAATSLLSLGSVLDIAKPGDSVFLSAYGFGAGSDAFSLKATPSIVETRGKSPAVRQLLEDKQLVSYGTALKFEYKLLRPENAASPYV